MGFIGLDQLAPGDEVDNEDEVHRGDFTFFERVSSNQVISRVVPRGALLVAKVLEDRVFAVMADAEALQGLEGVPVYYLDLVDVTEGEEGSSLSIAHLPTIITDDPTMGMVANFRAALAKISVCRDNLLPVSPSHLLSGFSLFYRDTSALGHLSQRYEPGRIILEKGFTDASRMRGSLGERTRFLIATREGHDMDMPAEGEDTGMVTLMCDARYLVVDHYVPQPGAEQIALLHVPTGAVLSRFLQQVDQSVVAALRDLVRADFDSLENLPPAPIPQSPQWQWRDRVSHPLGMFEDGTFPLDAWHQPAEEKGLLAFSNNDIVAVGPLGSNDNVREQLGQLHALLRTRNEIDDKIVKLIDRPALSGHIGEFVAAKIFSIKLARAANAKGIDGHFTSGPLAGRSVNVKCYGKHEGLLDIGSVRPDFYLVLTGPRGAAVSSQGTGRPFVIDSVFLFEAGNLVENLQGRKVKIGTATSVASALWEAAKVYPSAGPLMALNNEQREMLALFASPTPP